MEVAWRMGLKGLWVKEAPAVSPVQSLDSGTDGGPSVEKAWKDM